MVNIFEQFTRQTKIIAPVEDPPKLTAKGRSPRSREEAWLAWESARLELLRLHAGCPKKPKTPFEKRFSLAKPGWFLVALETMPNRGVVAVEYLNGGRHEVNIMAEFIKDRNIFDRFRVSDKFPEERARQEAALRNKIIPTAEIVLGKASAETLPLEKLPNNAAMVDYFRFTSLRDLQSVKELQGATVRHDDDVLVLEANALRTVKARQIKPELWKYLVWLKTPLLVNNTERRDWFIAYSLGELETFVVTNPTVVKYTS